MVTMACMNIGKKNVSGGMDRYGCARVVLNGRGIVAAMAWDGTARHSYISVISVEWVEAVHMACHVSTAW
jgi:hypothetical protein